MSGSGQFTTNLPHWWKRYLQAVKQLPDDWEEKSVVLQACQDFAESLQKWDESSQDPIPNIAIIGPKNSGKTFLLRKFLPTDKLANADADKLPVGLEVESSTRRLTWVGHSPPPSFDPRGETFLETEPLTRILPRYQVRMVDVPGFNERGPAEQTSARLALARTVIKILVIPPSLIETREWGEYLEECRGGWVFPVLNGVRDHQQQAGQDRLYRDLQELLGHDRVAYPVILPDLDLLPEDQRESRWQESWQTLQNTFQNTFGDLDLPALQEPERAGRLESFREKWGAYWESRLVMSKQALDAWPDPAHLLPQPLSQFFFPSTRATSAGLELALRGSFLQRTSGLLFPWKGFLGLAHLLRGAWQKIPFLFLGSLPAAAGSFTQAIRNWKNKQASGKPEKHVTPELDTLIRIQYQPAIRQLHEALAIDLQTIGHSTNRKSDESLIVTIREADQLRQIAEETFEQSIARQSPGSGTGLLIGGCGMLIFWGIFIWPLAAIYLQYYQTVHLLVNLSSGYSLNHFPQGTGAILGTALLLALFPVFLWIIVTDRILFPQHRRKALEKDLRQNLEKNIARALREGRVGLNLNHRILEALPDLFIHDPKRRS